MINKNNSDLTLWFLPQSKWGGWAKEDTSRGRILGRGRELLMAVNSCGHLLIILESHSHTDVTYNNSSMQAVLSSRLPQQMSSTVPCRLVITWPSYFPHDDSSACSFLYISVPSHVLPCSGALGEWRLSTRSLIRSLFQLTYGRAVLTWIPPVSMEWSPSKFIRVLYCLV